MDTGFDAATPALKRPPRRPQPVRLAVALVLLVVALAGCTKQPQVVPAPPHVDPLGEPFADARHCWAYNLVTTVARTDLMPLVPSGWSFENPLAPTVRVLVTRCPDQSVAFVTAPMRAGDSSAPRVEFLLEVFTEGADRDGPDDWARLGAPVSAATVTVSDAVDAIAIESPGGWAVRSAMREQGPPGRTFEQATRYGAGDPVARSWAEESAVLTTPLSVSSVSFGPGSVLRGAHVVPLNSGTWWGAYNAWYREGWP